MMIRPARARRGLCVLALTAGLLAGCSGERRSGDDAGLVPTASPAATDRSPDPSGTEPPAADPSPTEPSPAASPVPGTGAGSDPSARSAEPDWGLSMPLGHDGRLGIMLAGWGVGEPVTLAPAGPGPEGQEASAVTLHPEHLDLEAPVTLSLTTPGTLAATADGGLVLRDGDGTVVAGIAPPTGGARFAVESPTAARLLLPAAARAASPGDPATLPATVTLSVGERGVVSAEWRERSDGPSLFVDPTPWARAAGEAGWTLVWAELLAAHPEADAPGMHDQLLCHGVGARDKETWNLEPWRPDVGLIAVMAARCNPTG